MALPLLLHLAFLFSQEKRVFLLREEVGLCSF